jgi:hypothetical protein
MPCLIGIEQVVAVVVSVVTREAELGSGGGV